MNKLCWFLFLQFLCCGLAYPNILVYSDKTLPKRFEIHFNAQKSELILTQHSGRFFPRTERFYFPLKGNRQVSTVFHHIKDQLGEHYPHDFVQQMLWDLNFDKSEVQDQISIRLRDELSAVERAPSSKGQILSLGTFKDHYNLNLVLNEQELPQEFIVQSSKGDFTDYRIKELDGYFSVLNHQNQHVLTIHQIDNVRPGFIAFDLIIPIDDQNRLSQIEFKRLHLIKVNQRYVVDVSHQDIISSKAAQVSEFLNQYNLVDPKLASEIENQFRDCLVYQNYSSLSQSQSGLKRNCQQEAELEMKFKLMSMNQHQTRLARECLAEQKIAGFRDLPFGMSYFVKLDAKLETLDYQNCQELILLDMMNDHVKTFYKKIKELDYPSYTFVQLDQVREDISACLGTKENCKQVLQSNLHTIFKDFFTSAHENFSHDQVALLRGCLESARDIDQFIDETLLHCHQGLTRIPELKPFQDSLLSELDFVSGDDAHKKILIQNALISQLISGWRSPDRLDDLVLARIAVWKHHELSRIIANYDLDQMMKINQYWIYSITRNPSSQISLNQAYNELIRSKIPGQSRQEKLFQFIMKVIPVEYQTMTFFSSCLEKDRNLADCWLKQKGLMMLDQFQLEMEELIASNLNLEHSRAHEILSPLSHAQFCILNQSTHEPNLYFDRVRGCLFLTGFDISLKTLDQDDHKRVAIQCLSKNKNSRFQAILNTPLMMNEQVDMITLATSLIPQRLLRDPEMSELRSTMAASLASLGGPSIYKECLQNKRF